MYQLLKKSTILLLTLFLSWTASAEAKKGTKSKQTEKNSLQKTEAIEDSSSIKTSSTSVKKLKKKKKKKKTQALLGDRNESLASSGKIAHTASLGFNSSFSRLPGEKTNQSVDLLYFGGFRPNKNLSFTLIAGASTEVSGIERETQLNNTLIIGNINNVYKNKFGRLYFNTITTLPTNNDSREFESLYGRFQAGPNWMFNVGNRSFLRFRTNLQRGFHEFDRRTGTGIANVRYALSHRLDFGYAFNRYISFNTWFSNTHIWDYDGNRRPDFFGTLQSLDINLPNAYIITFGHFISDQTFGFNGRVSNIQLFDQRQSRVFMSLTHQF